MHGRQMSSTHAFLRNLGFENKMNPENDSDGAHFPRFIIVTPKKSVYYALPDIPYKEHQ